MRQACTLNQYGIGRFIRLERSIQNDEYEIEKIRYLDQLAYRFGKLQDTMGEKVLPLILEIAQEVVNEQASR